MVRFLSDEWVAALDAALARDPLGAEVPGGRLVVRQTVTGDGGTHHVHHLWFEGGRAGAGPGDGGATVGFTTTRDVAWRMATGVLNPQAAFLAGDLRVGGDVGALLAAGDVFDGLGDRLAALRDETTGP